MDVQEGCTTWRNASISFGPVEAMVRPGTKTWAATLAEACLGVGKPVFGEAMLRAANAVVPVDSCAVVIFHRKTPSGFLLNVGDDPDPQTAPQRMNQYLGGSYVDDPILPYIQDAPATPFIPPFAAKGWPSRSRWIIESVADRLPCVAALGDYTAYCNFTRVYPHPAYDESGRARLREVIPVLANLALAHNALCGASILAPVRNSEEEVQLLSQRFGRSLLDVLTERERQVCLRILLGYSSEAIGRQLGLPVSTIDTYRKRAYGRLNIVSQGELLSVCLRSLGGVHSELSERCAAFRSHEAPELMRDREEEVQLLSECLGRSRLDELTEREREVCLRILLGYSSEAIGLHLGVATSTVIWHRKQAYERLGIRSRNDLFSLYVRTLVGFTV